MTPSIIWAFLKSGVGKGVAAGLLLAITMSTCTVYKVRLGHAKGDLAAARAALYVPDAQGKPTKATWKDEALASERDFTTCKANTTDLQKGIDAQNSAAEALRADDAQRQAVYARQAQAAQKVAKAAQSAADRLATAHVAGADQCSRVLAMTKLVAEANR